MDDKLQIAWQRLIDHCHEHGLRDVLLTVRDGYAEELNSERRARGQMIREAVAKERERCNAAIDTLQQVLEDTRHQRDDLLTHIAGKRPLPDWADDWLKD